MSITPITAAEIGVLVTQKSESSALGSGLTSSVLSKDTLKKIMKIVLVLLVIGLFLTAVDIYMERRWDNYQPSPLPAPTPPDPYVPPNPGTRKPDPVKPDLTLIDPTKDLSDILPKDERRALVQRIQSATGLCNYTRNDCCLNSCMQFIMHSDLCDFLLNTDNLLTIADYKKTIQDGHPEWSESEILERTQAVHAKDLDRAKNFYYHFYAFAAAYSNKTSNLRTDGFRSILNLSPRGQEDSTEVLNKILSLYKPRGLAHKFKKTIIATHSELSAPYVSTKTSPMVTVELPFPEEATSSVSIKSLWQHAFESETAPEFKVPLPGGREALAENASQTPSFELDSENLLLVPKRFAYNKQTGKLSKIDTTVDFSGALPLNLGEQYFDLVAFTRHFGGYGGGHYISYVCKNGEWFEINDNTVTPKTEKQALDAAQNGYMFSFKKSYRSRSDSDSSDSSSDETLTPRSVDLLSDEEI